MNAGFLSLSRSTRLFSSASANNSSSSKMRRRSPARPNPDRIKSRAEATGGFMASRSLHSHESYGGTLLRNTAGRSEAVGGDRPSTKCSGTRHATTAANRRISSASMQRNDLGAKPDRIKFDQARFLSAKSGHQVSYGSKAVFLWANKPTRRWAWTGPTTTGSPNRIDAITTSKSPDKESGRSSATSSTCPSSMTSGEHRPRLQASTADVADKPSQSSVIVVTSKNRKREEAAAVSNSDSMVRSSPTGAGKVHATSQASAHQLSSTNPREKVADGHGLPVPEVYGKVFRHETGSKGTQEAGSLRQICSSASYTLVLDRMQRERASEHCVEVRDPAKTQHSRTNCNPGNATSAAETGKVEAEKVVGVHRGASRESQTSTGHKESLTSGVENAVTEKEAIRPRIAREAAAAVTAKEKRDAKENEEKSHDDKVIVCGPCASSAASRATKDLAAEFQEEKSVTDLLNPQKTASEGGTAVKVRLTKPVSVNETLAVDHFRLRLTEEKTLTANLKRKLGVVRKDLTKSRTDLVREEELRKRAEQWAEYLERELESYVRSRAAAEKRYLNLLQVVRGIDRFTKQLLHKYVALHRKVETGFDRLASDNNSSPQVHRTQKPHDSPGPVSPEEEATAARPDAAEARAHCPSTSTEEEIDLDLLTSDDYDFISKYLKASASLPEACADVDTVGLYPEADECDAEANWSSNNFVSFCEAAGNFDLTGRLEEQGKYLHVPETEEEEDGFAECAGDNRKSKNVDARVQKLGKFFDQVIRICRKNPEAYFRLLADKSCFVANEIRLSVDERRRRKSRSVRQGVRKNGDFVTKDFVFHVRRHGAGDIAQEGAHLEMENGNVCHEHVLSDMEDEAGSEEEDEEEVEDEMFEKDEVFGIDQKKETEKRRKMRNLEEQKLEERKQQEKRLEEQKREERKQEEKRLEVQKRDDRKREEQKQEERKKEERKKEERKQEEKKLQEEQRREDKRLEEKKRDDQNRERKKLEEQKEEEKKQAERRLEEQKREDRKREEQKQEERRREEQKQEERKREERKKEARKQEEKKLEEQKREEKRREEQKREAQKREEQKLEEQKREDRKREDRKREERKQERKLEEQKREERKLEEKKREVEKHNGHYRLKSTSPGTTDHGDAASVPQTSKGAKEEKAIQKKEDDHPSVDTELEERMATLDAVQEACFNHLITEICHYCDRYHEGDPIDDGIKAFLRDTIDADFLRAMQDDVAGGTEAAASLLSRNVDK